MALLPDGTRQRVSLDDPRWSTGEIVGSRKGTAYKKQTTEHISKRAKARTGKLASTATKQQMSATRKGKRPAYDHNGNGLGLVSITDTRWSKEIFTKQKGA